MTWKVTNSQDYAPKYIKYIIDTEAVTPGSVDYNFDVLAGTVDVDWGDGTSSTGLTVGVTTHTYASAGRYTVTITQNGTNTFCPDIGLQEISVQHKPVEGGDNFWDASLSQMANSASNLKEWAYTDFTGVTTLDRAWQQTGLTSFPSITAPNVTNCQLAWYDCDDMTVFEPSDFPVCTDFYQAWAYQANLASFPAMDLGSQAASTVSLYRAWYTNSSLTSWGACDTSNVSNIREAWTSCPLTSFPVIDGSQVTLAWSAWASCTSLTSFPAINMPLLTSAYLAWSGCTGLTSFPAMDLGSASSGCDFSRAWYGSSGITTFGACNFGAATNFSEAWRYCSSLATFPANMFNTATATNYTNAFSNCALTAASVENILVSIDASGVSNGTLGINGGTTAGQASWTSAATTAYNSLITKGWTIAANP